MNNKSILIVVFWGILLFIFPSNILAFSYSGQIGTNLYGFESIPSDTASSDTSSLDKHLENYYYITLNGERKNISFNIYSRLFRDWMGGKSSSAELFYGYADLKRIKNIANIRLGRQLIYLGVGGTKIDGIRTDLYYKKLLLLNIYTGREIIPLVKEYSTVLGGQISTNIIPETKIATSYFHSWKEGNTRWHKIGFDARNNLIYLTDFYIRTDYDLANNTISDYRVGFQTGIIDPLNLYGEYRGHKPTFVSNSIFTRFNNEIKPYTEIRIGSQVSVIKQIGIYGEYALTKYYSDNANRFTVGSNTIVGNINYIHSFGYGGKRNSISYDINKFFGNERKILIGAGINHQTYNTSENEDDKSATFMYGKTGYIHKQLFSLDLQIENIKNLDYEQSIRFLTGFNFNFGKK